SGEIVHWRNVTKQQDSRYGDVVLAQEDDAFAQIEKPYKYYPPFTIEFDELSEEQLSGNVLRLPGISIHIAKEGTGRRYESTCTMTVKERLDHLPKVARGETRHTQRSRR